MPTYNDGSVPYGIAGVLGVGDDPEAPDEFYVVEDVRVDESGSVIERRNGLNVMTGRVVIDDNPANTGREFNSATLRLQRATITQPFPAIGTRFLMRDVDTSNPLIATAEDARVWAIASGGQNYNQAEAHVFEVVVHPTASVV
jgi:hypothetical protein